MALRNWNLDWLAHNAVRNYPLAAECSGLDATGSFALPQDFLVGLDLPLSPALDVSSDRFFIHRLGAYATGFTVLVAYDTGTEIVDVATALVPNLASTRNKTYALGGMEPFDDTLGKVTVGSLATINAQPAGLWEFTLATARLEPDCIRPMIRGVTGLLVQNGTARSRRLTGDVALVAGRNIQLEVSGNTIRIDAIDGAGLSEPCPCEDNAAAAPCIKAINGVRPTAAGNLYLQSDSDCLVINGGGNTITLEDTCSAPCCGCEELEAITRDLEALYAQKAIFESFLNQLQTAVDGMSLTVLGAKLGDRGCVT